MRKGGKAVLVNGKAKPWSHALRQGERDQGDPVNYTRRHDWVSLVLCGRGGGGGGN